LVGFGAALLVWIMVFGFSRYRDLPERVPIDWSPALLMTGGPYAFSRKPMYFGELALWLAAMRMRRGLHGDVA
jgi:protein-S-isoprenylcysteine O-methyltransferase Ste14